jgi:FkbM family methyltransferase
MEKRNELNEVDVSKRKIQFADKLSEKIYYNLLKTQETKNISYLLEAIRLSGITPDPAYEWYLKLKQMAADGTRLILYGLGKAAKTMQQEEVKRKGTPGYLYYPFLGDIDWFGMCDKNADNFPEGFLGKRVMSVNELLLLKEKNICICIAAPDYYEEIEKDLLGLGIKRDNIVRHIYPQTICYEEKQYFDDFIDVKKESAVIDAGCYCCDTLERFIQWNKPKGYDDIIAYEPDLKNFETCKKKVKEKSWKNVKLINSGVSDKEYIYKFVGNGDSTSYASIDGNEQTQMISIDASTNGKKISFIKMDVEGFELQALKGAKECIKRDHPRLAIALYHKEEDLIEIPHYIQTLSKEYKFYLRIYSNAYLEIVLYAV